MKTLSVIVSSYNQLKLLELAMESYSVQSSKPLEVIVSDDGSEDGTAEWIVSQTFNFEVQFVSGSHNGYGIVSAFNRAAAKARGSRLLFTNADVIHCPASFYDHCEIEHDMVGIGIIAGLKKLETDLLIGHTRDMCRMECFRKVSVWDNGDFRGTNVNQNHVAACSGNLSMSADNFRAVGGFDEDYNGKWGCEDYDIIDRLKDVGVLMEWAKKSVGYHIAHPTADYVKARLGCKQYFDRK